MGEIPIGTRKCTKYKNTNCTVRRLCRTWKFSQNAMEFLALLLRDDMAIPVSVVQLFTKHCVSDMIYLRKVRPALPSPLFSATGGVPPLSCEQLVCLLCLVSN